MGRPDERRDPRVPLTLEVRFLEGQTVEHPRSGRTGNVGQGGAFVICDGPAPAVGSAVELTLEAPTMHQAVEFRGEVRWVKDEPHEPAGFGVRFIEADRRAAAALSALMQAQSMVGRLQNDAETSGAAHDDPRDDRPSAAGGGAAT